MDAEPRLQWERELIERGDLSTAAALLEGTLTQSQSLTPDEIEAIRELAEHAQANAGFLGKRRWTKIFRLADSAMGRARAAGL